MPKNISILDARFVIPLVVCAVILSFAISIYLGTREQMQFGQNISLQIYIIGLLLTVGLFIFFTAKPIWALYIFAFAVPLDLIPLALGLGNTITPARVMGYFLFVAWIIKKVRSREPLKLSWSGIIAIFLFGYATLSLLWAPSLQPGRLYSITLAQLVFMYIVIVDMVGTLRKAWRVLIMASFGGLVVIGIALYSGLVLGRYRTAFYIPEVLVPNKVAGLIAFGIGVALSLLFYAKKKIVAALAAIYIFCGALAVTLTGSRGGMLMLGLAGFAAIAFFFMKKRPNRWRAVVLLSLTIGIALPFAINFSPDFGWARWQRSDIFELGARIPTWEVLLDAWSSRPLLGGGLGIVGDSNDIGQLVNIRRAELTEAATLQSGGLAPHNVLVGALVNGGLIYFILWTIFICIHFFRFVKLKKRLHLDKEQGPRLFIALLVSFSIILMIMMIENVEYSKFVWLTLALIEAVWLITRRELKQRLGSVGSNN